MTIKIPINVSMDLMRKFPLLVTLKSYKYENFYITNKINGLALILHCHREYNTSSLTYKKGGEMFFTLSALAVAFSTGKGIYHLAQGETDKALVSFGSAALSSITLGVLPSSTLTDPIINYANSHKDVVKACQTTLRRIKV